MKVLLLGSNGQLGWELCRTCPQDIELVPRDYPEVDFSSARSLQSCIYETSPEWIINAAAYTAVDLAESEKEKAFRINSEAVAEIAALSKKQNIRMVHISTDYVFSGRHHKPWRPNDKTDPQSVYGRSKLKGEQAVQNELKETSLIVRTAWLYSSYGKNFVKTMLGMMKNHKDLKVIDEQIGSPTWAKGLALTIWTAVEKEIAGMFHWTDAGAASWYDFAVAIQEEAIGLGLLEQPVSISPVSTEQFPTPAQRPYYSLLDKSDTQISLGIMPLHWRMQLRSMLKELKN